MEALKLVLVVFHVASAALLFGAPLGLVRLGRNALQAGDAAFKVAVADVARRAGLASIGSLATLISGVALIFLGGGFAAVSKNFHAALGLMLLAVLFSASWIRPNTARLLQASQANPVDRAAAEAALSKLGAGTGILHGLWMVILVLMFYRF